MTYLLKNISIMIVAIFFSCAYASTEITWNQLKEVKGGKAPEKLAKALESVASVRGFMMPLDFSAKKISEFLLMPYVPACVHVPPPPAEQVILVKMEKGKEIEPSFYPVEITGKISLKESSEFEASFEMQGLSMKEIQ